jgi:hypothetical protein
MSIQCLSKFNWNKWGEGEREGKVGFAILMNRTYNLCEFT